MQLAFSVFQSDYMYICLIAFLTICFMAIMQNVTRDRLELCCCGMSARGAS